MPFSFFRRKPRPKLCDLADKVINAQHHYDVEFESRRLDMQEAFKKLSERGLIIPSQKAIEPPAAEPSNMEKQLSAITT